jgi:AraC-like DNA-binding protein
VSQVNVWSTDGKAPCQRVDYWNECAPRALHTSMTIDATEPGRFWGRIADLRVNTFHIAEVSSGPAAVRHSATQAARSGSGRFQILLQLAGHSVLAQSGRSVTLAPGDLTLVDCGRQYELAFAVPVTNLVLSLTHEQLKSYLACPEALVALHLPGDRGPSALVSRFLRELWCHPEDLVAGTVSPFLDRAILDMVATAYATLPRRTDHGSFSASTRRMGIIAYVEQHLKHRDLAVESVASACRVSPRYLHKLFDGEAETLGRYILRRRVEECARSLANPSQRGRSISWIAYEHGFSNVAHFSKVFRRHFGKSPREYREHTS